MGNTLLFLMLLVLYMSHKLFIKNMVCPRCISSIAKTLIKHQIPYSKIELGEIDLLDALTEDQEKALNKDFTTLGFELLNDKDSKIINTIKSIIIKTIHYPEDDIQINLSDLLSSKMNKDYSILSKTFSRVTGTTIENFVMNQKIERAKELLTYDELSITQIALELRYSSTAHLSNQFKKITGMTPSKFKMLKKHSRKSLDSV